MFYILTWVKGIIAVTWALDVWKRLEEIRKIRAETSKLGIFDQEELEQLYEGKIQKAVDKAVENHVEVLLESAKGDEGRQSEQRIDLQWALTALFARLERGMTVEIRFLPPPHSQAPEDAATAEAFQVLAATTGELSFPQMSEEPVLSLPKQTESN
jgi:hypothetical protein